MQKLLPIFMIIVLTGLVYQPVMVNSESSASRSNRPVKKTLHTGDIILRNGKGFVSNLFRRASQNDQKYSHAGVIKVTDLGIFVVHILGSTEENGGNIRQESMAAFCDPAENNGFAIVRYPFLNGKETDVKQYLDNLMKQNIRFDEHFDLQTNNEQYCTEMIYKLCLAVGNVVLPQSIASGQNYVGVDNLYLHGNALFITTVNY